MPSLAQKISTAKAAHRQGTAHQLLHQSFTGAYIRDFVYGANDGIITTFAVVAGVSGAALPPSIILVLGFANLLADGFSMAVGNYQGIKSEQDYFKAERATEAWEVDHLPQEERQEVRQIYQKKGFTGKDLDRAVAIITSNKQRWIDEMMISELGILPESDGHAAAKSALATFVAFILAGFMPLAPYVLSSFISSFSIFNFQFSIAMAGLTLFFVGSLRSLTTRRHWLRSGLEMFTIGAIAATVAYFTGFAIEHFINS